MKTTRIVIASVLVCSLLFTPSASAISCYVCKETDTGCGISFNYVTSVMSIKTGCNYCTKNFYNLMGTDHVSRDCSTESALKNNCFDATVGGYGGTVCACSSDLCNSASSVSLSLGLLCSAGVVLLVSRLFH